MGEVEIERKFRVIHPPEGYAAHPSDPIDQGYLARDANGTVVRLRRRGEHHSLTVKMPGDLVREEREIALTPEQFARLWPATAGRRLRKIRYVLPLGPHRAELDVYRDALAGLMTVEVEFATVEEARAFVPPPWFGPEVTEDLRYRNVSLALEGLPPGALQ